jgi:ATP-binding cassette subfamily E protein 1
VFPRSKDPPDWQEILKYFRGSELQNYFTKVLEDNLKALIKPQYVDHIPKMIKAATTVEQMLDNKVELENKQLICDELELNEVLQRNINQLSGGELQRFAIAMSCVQRANVYVEIRLSPAYPPNNKTTDTCSTNLRVIWT